MEHLLMVMKPVFPRSCIPGFLAGMPGILIFQHAGNFDCNIVTYPVLVCFRYWLVILMIKQ